MSAIAIHCKDHGQLTIPLASVNIVRKSNTGKAIIVFHNGSEITAFEDYKQVSDRMTSTQVWGSVTTEQA